MPAVVFYWAAFIAYSLIVMGMGVRILRKERIARRKSDNQVFWAAGKNVSGWAAGLSISASMMSISWSCVYGVQLFYWYGPGGAWLLIVPWLLTMLGFFAFAPFFRKFGAFSQPELLEKRFGTPSRRLLAPALILVFTVWGGAEIYAAGIIISPFLKIPLWLTLAIIAFVVAFYSYTGGYEAVVSTDKIQFLLVAFFITSIAVISVHGVQARGGNVDLNQIVLTAPKSDLHMPWYFSPGPALVALTLFAYLPGWLVETDVWIRLQSAKSHGEARKGVLAAGVNSFLFVGLMPLIIGTAALLLYPPAAGEIPPRLQGGAVIFSVIMQDFSPLWLNIVLSVGLIAATMSTVDTCGNVVALSFSYDILEPQLKSRLSDEQLNRLARVNSAGAILLAFIYALFTESLWDIFYLSSGILTTTVFPAVGASFLKNTSARQVNFAIVSGFLGTVTFYFLESHGLLQSVEPAFVATTGLGYILLGFLASAIGFVAGRGRA